MKRLVSCSLVIVLALGVVAALSVEGQATKEAKPYKMVADLYVVMEYADDVFYKIPDKVKGGKITRVRSDAMFIAEMMNISHYSDDYAKENGWSDALDAIIEDLVALSKVAKSKDKDGVTKQHKAVEAKCDSCHEKFRD